MGTFTRGPMWLQLAQHLLLFWLIHYSDATPFKETTTELADPSTLGCYYNYNHYSEGDRILTNEPCLNCTCHNKMLMCYLRVCPFTKPIGQDCTIEKREDQCCPIITCPEVPVELVDHSSGLHSTSLAMPDRYGCHINNQFYAEGSQIPSNPKKPCELCYCIRNMTSCVMQECTLHVEGCSPIYNRDVCCPVRYDCGRDSIDEELLLEESTTTVRPTPGFMLTTTMIPDQNHCVHNNEIYAEGEVISTEQPCEHCYCMRGDIVCAVQECSAQLENRGKHCKPRPPQVGQCCPDTYDCDIEGETTEESLSLTTTSPSDVSTESDNINEIEDDGLTKPLPITEHIDEFDKTTIASIGQRFDATGESTTQSILDDLNKLQDKLEITTMFYSAFDEDIDMNTVVPFKIPGEGSCLIDGVTYTNSSKIPVTNKCDKSCVCLNSLPQCIPIECDEPVSASNCKLIQNDNNLCCPVYDCTPAVTATEAAVSETERSTEAFTVTPEGVTKSIDVEEENVTELTELSTEKEPLATEQPEEPPTFEKVSETIQEATTQPSATEDKVTTQVAEAEEGEFVTVTARPLETAKTQKPITAEQGTQSPIEEFTKLPVDEEVAVTQKVYTVGPPTEGISEVTTVEPSASTEESTDAAEEISSEGPNILGTREGEIEVHTPVEGLIPVDSHVTPTEKIEGETSTLSQEELIPITEKTITSTQVQPEETVPEAIEGSGITEEGVSATKKPLSEEEHTEVSEIITETGATSAPSEEGSTRTPISSADVTEKTLPEEGPTEEIVEQGTTSAPSEEGSTSAPIPSADVTEKTEEPAEGSATETSVSATQRPIFEEGQTEVSESITEPATVSAVLAEETTKTSGEATEKTIVAGQDITAESVSEAEGDTGITEEGIVATEKSLSEGYQTEGPETVPEKTTTSATLEKGTTTIPYPGEVDTTEKVSQVQDENIIFTEGPTAVTTEKELEVSSEIPEILGIRDGEIEAHTTAQGIIPIESHVTQEAPTSDVTEKEVATSAPSIVGEEEATGKPTATVRDDSISATEVSATEKPSHEGEVPTEASATEASAKPSYDEVQTETSGGVTEQATTLSDIEEGTIKSSTPSESDGITVAPQEVPREPVEIGSVTEESISSTKTSLSEEVGTESYGAITEKVTSAAIEESITIEPRPSEELTEKPIVPIQVLPQETVTESVEITGATEISQPSDSEATEKTFEKVTEENVTEVVEGARPTEGGISATQKPSSDDFFTEAPQTITEKATTSSVIEEGTIEGEITEEPITSVHVAPQEVGREPVEIGSVTEESLSSTKTPLSEEVGTESTDAITEKVTSAAIEEGVTREPRPSEELTGKPIQVLPQETVTESVESTGATEEGVSTTQKPLFDVQTEVAESITEKGTTSAALEEGITKSSPIEVAVTEKTIDKVPEESVSEPSESGGVSEETIYTTQQPLSAENQTGAPETVTEKDTTFSVLEEGTTKESRPSEGVTEKTLPEEVVSESAESTTAGEGVAVTHEPLLAEDHTESITEKRTSAVLEEGTTKPSQPTDVESEELIEKYITKAVDTTEKATTSPIEPIGDLTTTQKSEFLEEVSEPATEAIVEITKAPVSVEDQKASTSTEIGETKPATEATGGVPTEISITEAAEKELEISSEVPDILGTRGGEIEAHTTAQGIIPIESHVTEEAPTSDETEIVASTPSIIEEEGGTEVSATLKPSQEEVQTEVSTDRGTTSKDVYEGTTKAFAPSDVTEKPIEPIHIFPQEATQKPVQEGEVIDEGYSATQKPLYAQGETEASLTEIATTLAPLQEDITKKIGPSEGVTVPEEYTSEAAEGSGVTEESVVSTQKPLSGKDQAEEITEKGATSAPSEEGATRTPIPSAEVTEKTLAEEEETEEGSGATEVAATQKPTAEESQTEVSENITEKGATSAPSEEGSTRKSIPSADVTEKTLIEEVQTEEILEQGTTSAPSEEGSTRKPIPSADVTEKTLAEEEQTDEILEQGTTSAPSEEGSTRKPIPSADVTEKTLPEEEQTEQIAEKGTTSAPSEEGSTRKPIPSADVTEKTLPEEEQTEEIAEKGTTSVPSEEGTTQKPIQSADVTEKAVPQEAEEGSGTTEFIGTQKPISEESQTDVSENITEKVATEEGSTRKSIPSADVTEKTLIEEGQTEEILEQGTTSAPSEEGSTRKPIPSADVTEKTLAEEEQTEEILKQGTTSASSEEGSTRKPIPSADVTEKTLPEEEQTEETAEKGTTSVPSEEGTTRKPIPSADVTEKAVPQEAEEGSGATEVAATQKPISEESQTEVSESVTEKGTTSAPSEEGSTSKPIPSADVTEKTLSEESVTEAEEGSGATETSVGATQKPIPEETQTEVSEYVIEKGTTLAALEEGTTEESRPSESITEKAIPEEPEPVEGSGATEKPVSVTQPLFEVQTESAESITEKGTTVSSIEETHMTILDIISPPQTVVPQKVEEITQPSIEEVTATSEREIPSESPIVSVTETEAEVTKIVLSTESELAATEKTGTPESPKESESIEQGTQKETEASATTQVSIELGVTEATEKELEISSEVPDILGTRYGEIEAHTITQGIVPIESHVTEEAPTSDVTEAASSTPSIIGEEEATGKPIAPIRDEEVASTPSIIEEVSATDKPISPIRDESLSATEVSATLKPSQEEVQTEISTSKEIDEGTTRPSVPSEEVSEVTEKSIEPIHIEPQGATKQPVTEEIVSSTAKPLSEEVITAVPENITEQGTTLATPEEGVTKESLPIDVTQESASEPTEGGAVSVTQKPLSEEVSTEVPEGVTEKETTSVELEGTTKESRPSYIESEKIAEGTTVSSVEVEEKFGGELTTEVQKITTIFDIISPPQTTVRQPADVSDLTTTQKSLVSGEESTSLPTEVSEEPITETIVEVTKAAEPSVTETIEKTEKPSVQGITEETPSAVEDLSGQKVDLTTVSTPSEEGLFQTEKAATASQVPTETEIVATEKAEETTEKVAESVTETTEPAKSTEYQAVITDLPIVSPTQAADKESATIVDENVTKAAEGTTLSSIDFEQKFGADNKTESVSDMNKMTTIFDIIFPTKAPTPVVQHEEVEQTTVALEDESQKDIALTTEKLAVTEKEFISSKAPSVDQTTYKPTVSSSSEIPSGQYDSGYEPGTSHYPGQTYLEEDYGDEEDQTAFGPGTCRYGGKLYVSAQQIPRDDPCDFCFCFRSDIICLQQSCPPPINGCHEEPIQGFCCPRYECPVSMATVVNMTTSTTTTSTTLPPHFLHHAYKGAATKSGCQIDEHTYQVGDMVPSASGPCIHCICGGDGQMKCDPKQCTPEPMLRQMIAITSRR